MKKSLSVLFGIILFAVSNSLLADFYGGAGIGIGKLNDDAYDPAIVMRGHMGDISQPLGWELGASYGSYSLSNGSLSIDIYGIDLSAMGSLSLSDHVRIFGRLGVMYWQGDEGEGVAVDTTYTGLRPIYGAGIDIKLSKEWELRLEQQVLMEARNHTVSQTLIGFKLLM